MSERAVTKGSMPGFRGTDHIGLTVPNLEDAVRFFVDVIGCESFFDLGPMKADDDWMASQLNVHPRAMAKIWFLRCGHGANIELFEYESPDQRREPPKNSDIGGHHLAFYVDDFDLALAHLRAHKVHILGEPVVRTEGRNAGQTWIYFLTPWGSQCELVSYPNGRGYEKEMPRRLWHPAKPEA
jgi:catechol 2,3-dioxygenase-like lactoylglutathione lyase family enzyme